MVPLLALLLALDPRAALDAGDAAWFAGERARAVAAWREAARSEDAAARAMAEVRLLRVSSNLGWIVHGPRADKALAACPVEDPWCDLAEADLALTLRDLGLSRGAGDAPALARRAMTALPGPAAARLAWAGALDTATLSGQDALSAGLREAGRWPAGPGNPVVGLGLVAGEGIGLGLGLRLVVPDLGYRAIRLEASGLATSRGAGSLALAWRTPGERFGLGGLSAARSVLDLYEGGLRETVAVSQVSAWAAPGLRAGRLSAWGGPLFRIDQVGTALAGHGLLVGAGYAPRPGLSARTGGELSLGDYALGRVSLDLRSRTPLGAHALAARFYAESVPWRDALTPAWRLPAAGGAELLRGAPAGRYRGPHLIAGALELRGALGPAWGVTAFAEAAWVPTEDDQAPHPGGGVGVRWRLPPRPDNTVRLDLGFTDAGWGLCAGFGEAF